MADRFLAAQSGAGSVAPDWSYFDYTPGNEWEASRYASVQEDIARQIEQANKVARLAVTQGKGGRGGLEHYYGEVNPSGRIEQRARGQVEELRRLSKSDLQG